MRFVPLLIILALGTIALALSQPIRGFVTGVTPPIAPALPLSRDGEDLPFLLPPGFTASLFAAGVPGARDMTRDQSGTLLVSLTDQGRVVALPDKNGDGRADETKTVLENLRRPHGLLVRCEELDDRERCLLFVAETDALKSYTYNADTFTATYKETITSLPSGAGHFTRTLLLHPDGKRLLISVGSSCNVCHESDARRASVLALDLQSKEVTIFARGLRNTVFMAIHPVTGEIWGTDMGRDLLGDDIPPDEINILRENADYGWPYCYGTNVQDKEFDASEKAATMCRDATPSHLDIPAHSAPLGLAFIPEEGWPEEYWHDLLVAYHGSWNRSTPTGYKIVRFDLDPQGNPTGSVSDFMTGFSNDSGDVLGRPVDILAEPGGTLYVSDDHAGAIYRVSQTSE